MLAVFVGSMSSIEVPSIHEQSKCDSRQERPAAVTQQLGRWKGLVKRDNGSSRVMVSSRVSS
jgi:hypothetical protein